MPDCITFAAPMPWSLLNLCHPRSMFRLTPVAKPFWSRGWSNMLPLLPPPLGGRNWTSNSCSLFLDTRLVAPHCLSSSVFWRFRVRRLWSSLRCHSLACWSLPAAKQSLTEVHVPPSLLYCKSIWRVHAAQSIHNTGPNTRGKCKVMPSDSSPFPRQSRVFCRCYALRTDLPLAASSLGLKSLKSAAP